MKNVIQESELILKPNGSIYHLALHPEELANTVILVGDPDRTAKVSKYFEKIEITRQNREIITHTGYFKGKRMTVLSTGMGTDNIDICVNELDALVNIDLKTRTVKDKITKLNIVRFGTSGSLQADIPVDSYVVSTHGIGLDVVMSYYQRKPNPELEAMAKSFNTHIGTDAENLCPYICEGSKKLIDLFKDTCIPGMTVSGAGFYAPQGRVLRYKLRMPNLVNNLHTFNYNEHKITNFEMETSAIYGLGHEVLGHNCCSINLIVANRQTKQFTTNMDKIMGKMIQMGLEKLVTLD
jgi:uridine phosphorylase